MPKPEIELKECPFCGAEPKEYDGDYAISHKLECFFTQQYAQETWLVSKRRIEQWNARSDNSHTPLVRERDELVSILQEFKRLLGKGGEYSVCRSDREPMSIVEAVTVGNVFERADKSLTPYAKT